MAASFAKQSELHVLVDKFGHILLESHNAHCYIFCYIEIEEMNISKKKYLPRPKYIKKYHSTLFNGGPNYIKKIT